MAALPSTRSLQSSTCRQLIIGRLATLVTPSLHRRHIISVAKPLKHVSTRSYPRIDRSVTTFLPHSLQRRRYQSRSIESSQQPLAGLWKTSQLQRLYYGSGSVRQHLLDCLPSKSSKAFIVTGSSLANKTQLIKQVEELLGPQHAQTFSKIGQHAPVKELDEATELVQADESIDTIISVGGGSPIDSAKAISYRLNEKKPGHFLHLITIPTTLSAAECTFIAGYSDVDGKKISVSDPHLSPHMILYDSTFALETPSWLWLSTGLRAMDHAVELMYHPTSTELPCRWMAIHAMGELFRCLVEYKRDPKNEDTITRLQLAAFASLGFMGLNVRGGLGLSHALGYALGSPYAIPHGMTSCLTLGHVVKLKAAASREDAAQLARLAPACGLPCTGDEVEDATAVGDAILRLVDDLGLTTNLTEQKVLKSDLSKITSLATGQESGPLYDSVKNLVEALF